jgi:hypothetical protein
MTAFDWSIIMIGPGGGISYSLMFICLLVEIYLRRKVVCFVLFCLSHWDLPTRVFHVALLVPSGSSRWVGMHWLGLRLFGATVWKLLIIEPFSQWKLNKIKTENTVLEFWGGCSWCYWKALGESDFIEFISHFSELRCERYWFFSEFYCWKFKQIAKIWVWKEKAVEPLMCSNCWI